MHPFPCHDDASEWYNILFISCPRVVMHGPDM
jgi:hypothetical protein